MGAPGNVCENVGLFWLKAIKRSCISQKVYHTITDSAIDVEFQEAWLFSWLFLWLFFARAFRLFSCYFPAIFLLSPSYPLVIVLGRPNAVFQPDII